MTSLKGFPNFSSQKIIDGDSETTIYYPSYCLSCDNAPCFFHCIYCGVEEGGIHTDECPNNTNLFPVDESGMSCSRCGDLLGDFYVRLPTSLSRDEEFDQLTSKGVDSEDIFSLACVGCAIIEYRE